MYLVVNYDNKHGVGVETEFDSLQEAMKFAEYSDCHTTKYEKPYRDLYIVDADEYYTGNFTAIKEYHWGRV